MEDCSLHAGQFPIPKITLLAQSNIDYHAGQLYLRENLFISDVIRVAQELLGSVQAQSSEGKPTDDVVSRRVQANRGENFRRVYVRLDVLEAA
jgi:hypothetical protein